MRLYITPTSPYARLVQIVIREKGLETRVELCAAETRVRGSPYYAINPSGRVPYLVRDDGVGLEESTLICSYLDYLDGHPRFACGETDWEQRRLEALARSTLDGLAVWGRELRRPPGDQSPTVIAHERARSERLADLWEREIQHPAMSGSLNLAQLTLVVGLDLEGRIPAFDWRPGHPALAHWADAMHQNPSVAATAPRAAT